MVDFKIRRRLLDETCRIVEERTSEREDRLVSREAGPPRLGDVFADPIEASVCWMVLATNESGSSCLIVPLDTNPLLGSGDIEVIHESADPWIARSHYTRWAAPDALGSRVDVIQIVEAERVRARWESLDLDRSVDIFNRETDIDPEYQDWIRSTILKAASASRLKRAVIATEEENVPNGKQSADGERSPEFTATSAGTNRGLSSTSVEASSAPSPHKDHETEISELLRSWSQGDTDARDRLMLVVGDELAATAGRFLEKNPSYISMEALDLVQDVMIRLLGRKQVLWQSNAHFRGTIANMMRHALVDNARARHAAMRNMGMAPVPLEIAPDISTDRDAAMIALDDALSALKDSSPEQYEVIIRHYFGGQTRVELAADMGIPEMRAHRHIRAARAFLRKIMQEE